MKTKLFTQIGWFCVPSSAVGAILWIVGVAFCISVFIAVDRHSHSVSDTLYGIFPYVVTTFLALDWIGRRSSEKSAP